MNNGAFYKRLVQAVREAGEVRLLTLLPGDSGDDAGQKALLCGGELLPQNEALRGYWLEVESALPKALPARIMVQGRTVLAECLTRRPRLVICGGGHISAPLAAIGAMLDFDVTVIDDRAEFANRERFPTAQSVLCKPFTQALCELGENPNTFYVIVTRGHSADRECLELIVKRPAAYVGMIGSRRKVAIVMEQMAADGFDRARLAAVHAPIGLKIGAQTPAEIAVCIAAELVQVQRAGSAEGCMEETMLCCLEKQEQPMVIAAVVEKTGSAPRSTGARMLVLADGTLYGSVGGGAGEGQACEAARDVLKNGKPTLVECNMTNEDAKKQGMVCGGKISVWLEPVN